MKTSKFALSCYPGHPFLPFVSSPARQDWCIITWVGWGGECLIPILYTSGQVLVFLCKQPRKVSRIPQGDLVFTLGLTLSILLKFTRIQKAMAWSLATPQETLETNYAKVRGS